MKKVIFFIICLFVITVGSLTSCQEVNPFDESMVSAVKYEKDFEHYVGTPAPRHAWGFDIASSLMGVNGTTTRAVYKQDMNVTTTDENGRNVDVRVTEFYGKPSDITQEEHDEVYAWFTNHRVKWQNNYANCGDGNNFTGSTKQFDGKAYTRSDEEGYTMLDMGSLVTKSPTKIGTCSVDNTIFFNGWIQQIAYDATYDEVADNGSTYNSANMNQLRIVNANGSGTQHLNDFNASNGYGWGNQAGQNGILVTDADFNELEYHCSADNKYHDKYILVHLIGSNYSGWYLGMDFEGGGQNGNERVKADGVCNDWIVKITDAGQSMFNPARILCEDLGANDFDFNDIVLDVSATTDNNGTLATFTIKAVGGTVPVRLCYGTESNYVIFSKDGQEELHTIFNDPDMRPINVKASNGVTSSQVVEWKVGFGKEYAEADYNFPNETLDLQKINFSVFHSNRAEWLTVRNYDENDAVCAPQMICVPVTVEWPEENEPIISHYPKFKEWVANPTKFFWKTETINTNNNSQNQNPGGNNNQQQGQDNNQQNSKLTVAVESNIEACSVTGGGDYDRYAYITLSAVAVKGYQFVKWTKDGQDIDKPATFSFNVNDDTAGKYVAVFEKALTYAEMFGTKLENATLANSNGIYSSYCAINTESLPKTGTIVLTFVNEGNDIYNSTDAKVNGCNFDTSNSGYLHWEKKDLGGEYAKNTLANPIYETVSITLKASEYAQYEMLMLIGNNVKTVSAYYKMAE